MRIFIIAAIVCFAIALLAELAVFTGTNVLAWVTGGAARVGDRLGDGRRHRLAGAKGPTVTQPDESVTLAAGRNLYFCVISSPCRGEKLGDAYVRELCKRLAVIDELLDDYGVDEERMVKNRARGHLDSCTLNAAAPRIRRMGCTCTGRTE